MRAAGDVFDQVHAVPREVGADGSHHPGGVQHRVCQRNHDLCDAVRNLQDALLGDHLLQVLEVLGVCDDLDRLDHRYDVQGLPPCVVDLCRKLRQQPRNCGVVRQSHDGYPVLERELQYELLHRFRSPLPFLGRVLPHQAHGGLMQRSAWLLRLPVPGEHDLVDVDREGDVLQILRFQLDQGIAQLVPDLVVDLLGDAYLAAAGQGLYPRSDVHSVAVDISALVYDVPDVDPYPHQELPARALVVLVEDLLDVNGTLCRVQRAVELDEKCVAHGLYLSTTILRED